MFLEYLRGDCLTHTSPFSDDGRMFSCFCQNTRVSRYVHLTLMNDFSTLHISKWKPYSVVCNVCGSCCDIFTVPKVVVLIIFNHCWHVILVTFFFVSRSFSNHHVTFVWKCEDDIRTGHYSFRNCDVENSWVEGGVFAGCK